MMSKGLRQLELQHFLIKQIRVPQVGWEDAGTPKILSGDLPRRAQLNKA